MPYYYGTYTLIKGNFKIDTPGLVPYKNEGQGTYVGQAGQYTTLLNEFDESSENESQYGTYITIGIGFAPKQDLKKGGGHLPPKKMEGHKGEDKETDLPLIFMRFPQGKGQALRGKIRYLKNPKERKKYEIVIKGNKLFTSDGKLFNTIGARNIVKMGKDSSYQGVMGEIINRYIYVMSTQGTIYAADFSNEYKSGGQFDSKAFPGIKSSRDVIIGFHHSSFLAGQPVACAGEIQVNNGILEAISNASGHYLPTPTHLYNFLDETQKRSKAVNLSKVEVDVLSSRFGGAKKFKALEFVKAKGDIDKCKEIKGFWFR